ncbi:MAG: response regulator [Clostridia bacterium]|nr:response regulator [Clostridia bacterium]
MQRILIVDDEPIIVRGLLSVLGERLPDADLYSAGSGMEALSLLAETRMDIVVSDMAMPGMDGLQLMKRIHADWPECRVIFLSGHNEFDMIYQAIQNEAVTFILKTEGFDKIIATIQDTIRDIELAQRHRNLEEQLSVQQETTRRLLQREALTALVQGRSRNIYSASMEIDLQEQFLPLYAYIESDTLQLTLEEYHEKLLDIDRALRLRLAAYPIRIAFWNHHEDILWLLQPSQAMEMRRCMLYARENMELIQEAIHRETGMTLAFALHTSSISADQLANAYQALRRRICQGVGVPGMIALQSSSSRDASGGSLLPDLLTSRLREAMEHMNRKEFMNLLTASANEMRKAQRMDDPYALEAFLTLSRMFLSYINRWKLHDSVQFPGGLSGLTSITGFASWDQAADAFIALGKTLLKIHEGDQGSRGQAVMAQIRDHIERNLNRPEELSLSRIAEITYFNPAYLSRLFHQITGETLSDYVSGIRVQKANEMLRDNAHRISDISEAVGFSSSANFSRFYRKMMGCSPQEYREKLAKQTMRKNR